jgi:hypothetical protein
MVGFPAIAYPYPPIYHLASEAMAKLLGADGLAGGRAVSLVSLLATAAIAGAIARRIAAADLPSRAAWLPAVAASLILLSTWPVLFWTPLMRVDMLGLCFSLAGVYFSMVALDRHRWVFAASLCFLLAVYTKQVMLAAPAASFFVLLLLRPRTAVAGITTCLVLGLAALGTLEWATSGGFAHHLFASNVSRVFLSQLSAIPVLIASHSIYVGLGVLTIAGSVASLRKLMRLGGGLAALRERVAADRGTAMSMILLVYFGLATPMLFAIAKSGANLNYLIEWTNIVAIFAALSLTSVAKAMHVQGTGSASSQASLLPAFTVAALVVQSLTLPTDRFDLTVKLPSEFESRELSRMVRPRPSRSYPTTW